MKPQPLRHRLRLSHERTRAFEGEIVDDVDEDECGTGDRQDVRSSGRTTHRSGMEHVMYHMFLRTI